MLSNSFKTILQGQKMPVRHLKMPLQGFKIPLKDFKTSLKKFEKIMLPLLPAM